jgi:hypothetical protein
MIGLRVCGCRGFLPQCADSPLSHYARNTTRLVPRARDLILEIATCARSDIAGPHIGPGPAFVLGLARRLASRTVRFSRNFQIAVIAAEAVNGILDWCLARLDHASTVDAGNTAFVLRARRHEAFQPADRDYVFGTRIRESPCVAARVALAASGAYGRIARALGQPRPRPPMRARYTF